MKRVLFLLSHTEKGGGEVVIYNLVKHLDRKRYQPFVGMWISEKGIFLRSSSN